MNRLRTLYLGGTGIISSACVTEAVAAGHDVTVLNRGTTTHRPLPDGVLSRPAAGVEANIVHISSDAIAAAGIDADWGDSLVGDKAHSLFFDNSKIKAAVPGWQAEIPYWRGAGEIVEWHDADAARRVFDDDLDAAMDRLIARLG